MLLYLFGVIPSKIRRKNPKLSTKALQFYNELKGRKFKNYSKKTGKTNEGYTPGLIEAFKHEWIENESAFLIDEKAEQTIDDYFKKYEDVILHVRKFKTKD